jgi:DinB family protein
MPVAKVAHTKRATTARIDAEYRALDRVVRSLGTRGLARDVPGFGARARIRRERWTGKDALAHIVEWKRQALRALRSEASDPRLRGLPIDRKNRVLYERWHRRPARDVVAYHRAVQRDVVKALRALPESYFAKRRSPYWPGDLTTHAAGHRRRHLEVLLVSARPGRR